MSEEGDVVRRVIAAASQAGLRWRFNGAGTAIEILSRDKQTVRTTVTWASVRDATDEQFRTLVEAL